MKAKDFLKLIEETGVDFSYCGFVRDIGELNSFMSIKDHLKFYFGEFCVGDEEINIPTGDYFWIYYSDLEGLFNYQKIIQNTDLVLNDGHDDVYLVHVEY